MSVVQLYPTNDLLNHVPELPRRSQRWTVRRKATVIEAVRGGWVAIEEICELYNLSVDEFLAWERDVDRYGVPGLRANAAFRSTVTPTKSAGARRCSSFPQRQ